MAILTDRQIQALLQEKKVIRSPAPVAFPFRSRGAHNECEFLPETSTGNSFEIRIRQSVMNPLDFSVILIYRTTKSNLEVRLVRYNGLSHEHANPIEKQKFYSFHIHRATERYMARSGSNPETFAEQTDRYSDLPGAFRCFIEDCNIEFLQGNLI